MVHIIMDFPNINDSFIIQSIEEFLKADRLLAIDFNDLSGRQLPMDLLELR
jgi:hypothetical protein